MANSMFINARCNICNSVSHAEISDGEDQFEGSFSPDPSGPGYLCHECSSVIEEVKTQWDQEDQAEDEVSPENDEELKDIGTLDDDCYYVGNNSGCPELDIPD